ncbi:ABC transporter permease [Phytopseudomonas dryadis]|uniref:ABC transporter permease n=1 Tax=Phytopseudomonas dryadis TaxID=2487520 RepID=A0A4Q9QVP7_9GAMM|nr:MULTISPECIES: ABC transporter permease [Pseudomonas]TBU87079.1 ABC transporter permease [Pseudomonas dryadis]TBV09456.1 ABC transporter permease [Pseudomonas dryadis]TBV13369.1 ABC transporter permease [Pseudomonas sp. FRB 230]
MKTSRPLGFYVLSVVFALFVLFLYGPTLTIGILSFQGPSGGLTFPMNGVSLHWFRNLFQAQQVGDFGGSFSRSILLGLGVMACTLVFSLLAGFAYRRRFAGGQALFYLTLASLIIPSILVSLGIGLMYDRLGWEPNWFSSAFGAHLTWTLPFGLLIMFAVFNRFDRSYEMAARDLGASPWQTVRLIVLPLIAPSLFGVALFGLTLSYDEFARTLMVAGSFNTLPLEVFGMTTNVTTPVLYALGTLTTLFSFSLIALVLLLMRLSARGGKA